MPGTMRGVYTNLTEIRRKVFAGVARIAYEQGEDSEGDLQRLPYEIVPGEIRDLPRVRLPRARHRV